MKNGVIGGMVEGEIKKYGFNVFKEAKIDLIYGASNIIHLNLGELEKGTEGRNFGIKIEYKNPKESWIERGIDFFENIGEECLEAHWPHHLGRICKPGFNFNKTLEMYNGNGKSLWQVYDDMTPFLTVKGETKHIKNFLNTYKDKIVFDDFEIRKHAASKKYDLGLRIKQNLFEFKNLVSNKEAIKYASLVDELLK